MKILLSASAIILSTVLFQHCSANNTEKENSVEPNKMKDTVDAKEKEVQAPIDTTPPFNEFVHEFNNTDVLLPEGFSYQILFREEKDLVTRADGQKFPAKGSHDMCQFIPKEGSNDEGLLVVSHESRKANANLGDGGGATTFHVKKDSSGKWNVTSEFQHVDFVPVGLTFRNCGGSVTPNGTILTAEEAYPYNNSHIPGITDQSPYNGRERYLNYGYMVEFDPHTREIKAKHLAMGRFMHEDAHVMEDNKTVYMTDDFEPGVFFKFIADTPGDYSKGQLYAYQQGANGMGGRWITMPKDTISLLRIRDVAIDSGATIFCRHEWIEEHNGKLYISETGDDDFDWSGVMRKGGKPAHHFGPLHKENGVYADIHGRILEFDPETNQMSVWLEGGVAQSNSKKIFSNPDCLSKVTLKGKTYLVVSEDLNGFGFGRMLGDADARKVFYNELYFVDLELESPTVDDMLLFAVGPGGSETTGSAFTPDGKTMFLNIMHPTWQNGEPWRRSATIVIQGFE